MFSDFEHLDLEFVSNFVLLISDLNILHVGSSEWGNIVITKTAQD